MEAMSLLAKLTLDSSHFDKGLRESESSASGFVKRIGSSFSGLAKGITVGLGAAFSAAATGLSFLTKNAVSSFSQYEQLVGGVRTLFGDQYDSVEQFAEHASEGMYKMGQRGEDIKKLQEEINKTLGDGEKLAVDGIYGPKTQAAFEAYAKSGGQMVQDMYEQSKAAAQLIQNNADEAFETAGLSANEYMETVTSFSASLIQSLDGDTMKAAELSDMAIKDMSDNANKMGTSMESIRSAYSGFAKQNYTMLDNLKLGYGGTKSEMERLIADANKLKVAQGGAADLTIESYADIIEAIHLVQDNMGILGATKEEADKTIEGSFKATKAAWANLLTALGSGRDLKKAMSNLKKSAKNLVKNVVPIIKQALLGIGELIQEIAPIIADELPDLIISLLPSLIDASAKLINAFAQSLPRILGAIISSVKKVLTGNSEATWGEVGQAILKGIKSVLSGAGSIIKKLITGDENASWPEVGNAILNGVKTTLASLGDTIKGLITGDEKASWPEVANAIINGIGSKATELFNAVKNALTPTEGESNWSTVGEDIWTLITTAISTAAQNSIDFWSGVIDDGINRGGVLGTLESTLGRAMLLAAIVRKAIVDAVNKLYENGTLGTIWTTLQSIVQDVLNIIGEIFDSLGANSDDAESLGNTLSSTITSAVQIISVALQAAEAALSVVLSIVEKANEWGILDDAITSIATVFVTLKALDIVNYVITLFKSFALGGQVLTAISSPMGAFVTAVVILSHVIPAVVDGWNKMMNGISEAESNEWGFDALGQVFEGFKQSMYASGIEGADELAAAFEAKIPELQEIVANSDAFSEDVISTLMGLDNSQWAEVYAAYKANGAEGISQYVLGLQSAAEEVEGVSVPYLDDESLTALNDAQTKSENANASLSDLVSGFESLQTSIEDTSGTEMSFDDAVQAGKDLLTTGQEATKTILDTSTSSEAAMNTVKVASETAAKDIVAAFVKMGEPIGPVFDSIVLLCQGMMTRTTTILKTIPVITQIAFEQTAMNIKRSWSGMVEWFGRQVSSIRSAINSIPKNVSFSATGLPGHSEGGVITRETISRLGEGNKKEYVIPVTKPNRAIPLLQQAANDLGLNSYGARNAFASSTIDINQVIKQSIAEAVGAVANTISGNQQPKTVQLVLDTGVLLGEVDLGLSDIAAWRGGGRA